MKLAGIFLERLKASEAGIVLAECGIAAGVNGFERSMFGWAEKRAAQDA